MSAFEAAIARACENPERFPVVRGKAIRKIRINGFPVNILYRILGQEVVVLAIAAHRRRPGYWLGRR